MASFVGTFDEFIKYINPRAKNVVNSITRKYKAEKGKCEHCGSKSETLEAAHVTGRERPKIIEETLDQFRNGELITVDLEVFENLFLEAHTPIDEVILVLCRACHKNYDSKYTTATDTLPENTFSIISSQPMTNSEITSAIRAIGPNLTDEQVADLQSLEYCRNTFFINYPVLKKVPINSDQETIRQYAQVNGHNRWSTQRPIERSDSCFLVTTQWTDRHRQPFKEWLETIKNDSPT